MFRDKVQFLTLAAAAHKLAMPKKTLVRLVNDGVLPAFVFEEKGKTHYRFDPLDIQKRMLNVKMPSTWRGYRPGKLGYDRQLNLV